MNSGLAGYILRGLQATAPASQLEVVVTEAEAAKLAAMAEKGKRFMVLYS